MPVFLHVGCGAKRKGQAGPGFRSDDWQEIRFDIDEAAEPDIVGSMLDLSAVATASVDGVFSSHNIEHLYAHEVPVALAEFHRVLRPDGVLVVTCPDLQSVCALVAEGKLVEPALQSAAGSISALDILYGHRPDLAAGNLFMAHRCGFTLPVLLGTLQAAGFEGVAGRRREGPYFDLWAVATPAKLPDETMRALAIAHFG